MSDSYQEWLEALADFRKRMIADRKIKERDDADDQAWFERMKVRDG